MTPEPLMVGRLDISEPFEFAGSSVAVVVVAVAGRDVLCEVTETELLGDVYSHVVLKLRSSGADEHPLRSWECSCIPMRVHEVESEPPWGAQYWRGGLALRARLVRLGPEDQRLPRGST